MTPSLQDRFRGCLVGLAIGDALGGRFEGQAADYIHSRVPGVDRLLGSVADELWYTDDTQMAIGVAETLAADGAIRELASLGNGIEALASVPTAIASFALTPGSYVDTIGNAILVGGDTDTIAAMAGAISGAFLGIGVIPEALVNQLEDSLQGRTYIIGHSDRLLVSHQRRTAPAAAAQRPR